MEVQGVCSVRRPMFLQAFNNKLLSVSDIKGIPVNVYGTGNQVGIVKDAVITNQQIVATLCITDDTAYGRDTIDSIRNGLLCGMITACSWAVDSKCEGCPITDVKFRAVYLIDNWKDTGDQKLIIVQDLLVSDKEGARCP